MIGTVLSGLSDDLKANTSVKSRRRVVAGKPEIVGA